MTKRLAVSRAAQSDINDIYDYTLANWGRAQADDYVTQLEKSLTAAAAGEKPLLSFAEWQTNAGYMFVGKHTVFVLEQAEQLLAFSVI
ncbi:type II toxin-antitoxin system RelE/ParE family toxin [bacterium]|nr:type II toxin-antitoxin system RelE/ParE family toxin [bacterium]